MRRFPITLVAAILTLAASRDSAAQSSAPAPTKPDATVSDTRLGLENLELLQKGIQPGGQGTSLTPDQLVLTPELLNAEPTPELPEQDRDDATLRELRRRQWSSENWLVEGMRRTELAADEGDLAEDAWEAQNGGTLSPEDTSARARVEAGRSDEWLAMAVETQRETEANAQRGETPESGDQLSAVASKSSAEGTNPLGDFMAGWLSGDSRVMLSSSSERSADSIASLPAGGGGDGGRIDGLFLAQMRDPESRTNGVVPVQRIGDALAANPFLVVRDSESGSDLRPFDSGIELPGPNAPNGGRALQLENLLPASPAPVAESATFAPVEKPDEKPSEPWRPPARDDEKYFPRLKRF